MSAIATAIVGTALVSGYMSNQAANTAANAQTNAANQANATGQAQYDQTRQDLAPWREAGASALGQLSDLTGANGAWSKNFSASDMQADPGYDFRMKEGQKALERSAAARGGVLGGGTLKALTRYGQDQGSQEYGAAYGRFMNDRTQRFNQLSSIAGLGQTSTVQTGQLGAQNAASQGANLMGAANATGASAIAGANAWGGALNNGVNNWLTYQGYK